METKDTTNPTLRIGIRVLIIIIVLLVLFFLSLGIIKLVPKALDGISSLRSVFTKSSTTSSSTTESLTVITDKTVVGPNDTLTISWKHDNPKQFNGAYAFKYQCESPIVFEQITNNAVIPCNTDYTFATSSVTTAISGEKSIMLKVAPSANSQNFTGSSSVEILIDYINPTTNGVYISGSNTIMYENAATSTTTASRGTTITTQTVAPNPTYVPPRSSVPAIADLQVKILSVGVLTANNQFVSSSQVGQGQRAAVQFQISNIGGAATGNWTFAATLPSSNPDEAQYVSPLQASLQPGGSVLYTLGFDQSATGGNQTVTITADPNNTVTEISKANNTATTNIFTSGNGAGYGYGTTGTTPDLAISTTQAGYIASNGQFVPSNSIPYGTPAAVEMTVINQGGSPTGAWSFTANVNSNNTSYNYGYNNGYQNSGTATYNSGSLPSLAAGGSQTFTIRLDSLGQGTTSLYINLDPNYQTQDANRSNNVSTVQIYVD